MLTSYNCDRRLPEFSVDFGDAPVVETEGENWFILPDSSVPIVINLTGDRTWGDFVSLTYENPFSTLNTTNSCLLQSELQTIRILESPTSNFTSGYTTLKFNATDKYGNSICQFYNLVVDPDPPIIDNVFIPNATAGIVPVEFEIHRDSP